MPIMRTFSPRLRRLPRLAAGFGPAHHAGGVKIIDTFAVGAALAIQSRRAQAVQCAVEFGFGRGVNEPDTGSKPILISEDFLYVLDGVIEVHLRDQTSVQLRKGDSMQGVMPRMRTRGRYLSDTRRALARG
jgi:hypothetical protein